MIKRPVSGFTLIEILVVITIIGLLIAVSGGAYMKYTETAYSAKTRAFITELEGYADAYNDIKGDYPPSSLNSLNLVTTGDDSNEGIEAFVQAIYAADYSGHRPDSTSDLINTDEDDADKKRTVFGFPALLEFQDSWGNPLIYIQHTDYDKSFTYFIDGPYGLDTIEVSALKNPRTGTYYRFESCQIISLGPDGIFNTDDDECNFDRVLDD